MFLFRRNRKQAEKTPELSEEESAERFLEEHEYKLEHDPEYRKSIERSAAFFKADTEARKAAGLDNKIGSYTFNCPNCGTLCKGEWVRFDSLGNLHGGTGCPTCNIHLRV